MKAEILATGDEIRSGALVDSNSAFISEQLEQNGVEVTRHTSLGDDIRVLSDAFCEIASRSDLAIVTGGLGPTTDDLSAEAAADAAGLDLEFNQEAYANVESFFRELKRPMSESNRRQAMLPQGCVILRNPVGTAPGFTLDIQGCRFFFLPGVPYEMKRMLADAVLPRLIKLQGDEILYNRVKTLTIFGLPESIVGEKMTGVEEAFPPVTLGMRANFPQIQVKLYCRGRDPDRVNRLLDRAGCWAAKRLGDHVISQNGESMETVVGTLLIQRGESLALAESCTGGLVANWLTNVAGSSDYFLFSGVTYSNQAKIDVLSVKPETIEIHGAVHENTAREMAEGARRISGATFGLSTSGVAGPGGGTGEKPVGTVCIGFAGPGGSFAKRRIFRFGKRLMNKKMFAMAALDVLRRELIKSGGQGEG